MLNGNSIRILAISPRFAPTNGADTHRIRLLLNHAAASGWEAEVLAVDAVGVVGPIDQWLAVSLPANVPVHRVRAWQLRGWGLNGLAQRSFWPLYRKGCELLASGRFDLVFFSTTEFALHVLGPLWKRKYGVPFCMDYQDPWVNDYYRMHPEVTPPGGRFKYAIADRLHRVMERYVVPACSGYLAVSQGYLADLKRRYGNDASGKPMLVRPFPAEPAELKALETHVNAEGMASTYMIWRYIGRGGPDMARAARAFFHAWGQAIDGGILSASSVCFQALGTSYAAAGTGEKSLEPLVEGTRLASLVWENPDRLGYSVMLEKLLESDALVVFGSDDPAYTASKIYPYLMAGKPLLAIFHENSSVVRLMHEVGGGICVTFNERTTSDELAAAIGRAWFEQGQFGHAVKLDAVAFEPYTAKSQALELAEWFSQVCSR